MRIRAHWKQAGAATALAAPKWRTTAHWALSHGGGLGARIETPAGERLCAINRMRPKSGDANFVERNLVGAKEPMQFCAIHCNQPPHLLIFSSLRGWN